MSRWWNKQYEVTRTVVRSNYLFRMKIKKIFLMNFQSYLGFDLFDSHQNDKQCEPVVWQQRNKNYNKKKSRKSFWVKILTYQFEECANSNAIMIVCFHLLLLFFKKKILVYIHVMFVVFCAWKHCTVYQRMQCVWLAILFYRCLLAVPFVLSIHEKNTIVFTCTIYVSILNSCHHWLDLCYVMFVRLQSS